MLFDVGEFYKIQDKHGTWYTCLILESIESHIKIQTKFNEIFILHTENIKFSKKIQESDMS